MLFVFSHLENDNLVKGSRGLVIFHGKSQENPYPFKLRFKITLERPVKLSSNTFNIGGFFFPIVRRHRNCIVIDRSIWNVPLLSALWSVCFVLNKVSY